jgi:hypothetical protein
MKVQPEVVIPFVDRAALAEVNEATCCPAGRRNGIDKPIVAPRIVAGNRVASDLHICSLGFPVRLVLPVSLFERWRRARRVLRNSSTTVNLCSNLSNSSNIYSFVY